MTIPLLRSQTGRELIIYHHYRAPDGRLIRDMRRNAVALVCAGENHLVGLDDIFRCRLSPGQRGQLLQQIPETRIGVVPCRAVARLINRRRK